MKWCHITSHVKTSVQIAHIQLVSILCVLRNLDRMCDVLVWSLDLSVSDGFKRSLLFKTLESASKCGMFKWVANITHFLIKIVKLPRKDVYLSSLDRCDALFGV